VKEPHAPITLMFARWRSLVPIVIAFTAACASAATSSPPGMAPPASLPSCCTTAADVKALDGQRVELVGVYTTTAVRKGKQSAEDDARARTVAIHASDDVSVMVGVYYAAEGERPLGEITRFNGKRVRVIGILHARTPDAMEGTTPIQTMIGPCITEIEGVEAVRGRGR
jgi:hypothetical protein